jgi:hypothetical protein
MRTLPALLLALALPVMPLPANAQGNAQGNAQNNAAAAPAGTPEPKVRRVVIEDDGARIEELSVRGQTQRIVVTPKVAGAAPYEIITGDGSRELSPGAGSTRGAAGKRVWNVLNF